MSDQSTSSQNPGEKPEPQMDAPPDPGPGGPADWIDPDEDDVRLATPDQPRSAQVEDDHVPDEIEDAEDLDEDDKDLEPGDEPPA
ncbi:hypothetical protein [Marmoricola sp. URHB0036]|uniref:hypothetical protein n=1 Tax=Marmoricola sp. URHB0036 TaxID=1298863 RepID=UPI00041877CD|nr:hypothetical protein [Marmoricola sp. URHB0036]